MPHDWAIHPYDRVESRVGGGMGRLPSLGVTWFLKRLGIPEGDAPAQSISQFTSTGSPIRYCILTGHSTIIAQPHPE